MTKNLLFTLSLVFTLGLSTIGFAQSTLLYAGFNSNSQFAVIDTVGGTYTVSEYRDLLSDLDDVSGCFGLALHPITNDMYILYQLDDDEASNRRVGTLDTLSGEISDIGLVGNMTDIAFYNSDLYAVSGSYSDHGFYNVDITDASTELLLNPSTDNEAGAITNNFYSGEMFFVDEDHFTTIDLISNTEMVDLDFLGFDDECNAIAMKNDSIALVSNYEELYEFNINSYEITYMTDFDDNVHGLAFGKLPLAVTINGSTIYCSTSTSILSVTEEGTSYQWFLEGDEIVDETEATIAPLVSGAYSCEVDGILTQNSITVEVIPAPEVSFTATPNPVFLGDDPTGTVDFVNTTATGDEFVWDFDNGFSTVLENPSFSFTIVGTYDVTLWVTDTETGCTDSTFVTVVVNDGVGIGINSNDFSVFPTITNDLVTVSYNGKATSLNGKLVDLNGRVIETKLIQPNANTSFDLSELEMGVYLIQVSGLNSEATTYRVVKN